MIENNRLIISKYKNISDFFIKYGKLQSNNVYVFNFNKIEDCIKNETLQSNIFIYFKKDMNYIFINDGVLTLYKLKINEIQLEVETHNDELKFIRITDVNNIKIDIQLWNVKRLF